VATSKRKASRRSFLRKLPGVLVAPTILMRSGDNLGTSPLVSLSESTQKENRFTICGGGVSALIVAHEHKSCGRYVASVLQELTGKLFELDSLTEASNRPIILIGDPTQDERIRRLASDSRVRRLGPEGILLLTTHEGSRPVLVVAGGSHAAVNYACGELLNFQLNVSNGEANTESLDLLDNPQLPYRMFWNWDHSTIWARGVPGEQEIGCANPYLKQAKDYLNDYRRIADFMGEHKLNGLIVWGFLRDGHGGVKTSQEIVSHANERGVKILPGYGTSYYGGPYYEGNHPFNVYTWLSKNPELRIVHERKYGCEPQVVPIPALCPSKSRNQQWLREGAEWFFTEFPGLGGVNLENGDFLMCECEDCKRARERPGNDPNFYYDMMANQLPIIEVGSKLIPQAWFTFATYTGFNEGAIWPNTWNFKQEQVRTRVPRFVEQYPDTAICQWTYTYMVDGWGREPEAQVRKKWPSGLRPPTKHSIGLLHQGSQGWPAPDIWWTKSARGSDSGQRFVDISELIRYTCMRCAEEGLEGLEITGEVSDDSPANELNYLALEEFGWHPDHTMEQFEESRLLKIYGSKEEAKLFLQILRNQDSAPSVLLKHIETALEVSHNSQLNPRQKKRWTNLASEISRRFSLAV